ncbi:hypothetical protein EVAR_42716_1 [Eumeta japonica]|uniref:Uncharacterized protein n=1 Tax=Eumeta variegata TaxID=151549 RepID=A0A4C1X0P9_EUMVA|nr:hypothetical protein EVAR_42716_1 [Eumeta japonica]
MKPPTEAVTGLKRTVPRSWETRGHTWVRGFNSSTVEIHPLTIFLFPISRFIKSPAPARCGRGWWLNVISWHGACGLIVLEEEEEEEKPAVSVARPGVVRRGKLTLKRRGPRTARALATAVSGKAPVKRGGFGVQALHAGPMRVGGRDCTGTDRLACLQRTELQNNNLKAEIFERKQYNKSPITLNKTDNYNLLAVPPASLEYDGGCIKDVGCGDGGCAMHQDGEDGIFRQRHDNEVGAPLGGRRVSSAASRATSRGPGRSRLTAH